MGEGRGEGGCRLPAVAVAVVAATAAAETKVHAAVSEVRSDSMQAEKESGRGVMEGR